MFRHTIGAGQFPPHVPAAFDWQAIGGVQLHAPLASREQVCDVSGHAPEHCGGTAPLLPHGVSAQSHWPAELSVQVMPDGQSPLQSPAPS